MLQGSRSPGPIGSSGPSILARWAPPAFKDGIDGDAVDGAVAAALRHPDDPGRVRPPRGAGAQHRLLARRGSHPQQLRDRELHRRARGRGEAGSGGVPPRLLGKSPRARAVLEIGGEGGRLGRAAARGKGRGVSLLYSGWDTYLAQVAEVEVSKSGDVRVHRVVCAVDCGTVVNPDTVKAQIESGIVFGISAALWGEITLKNGRVEQSNFNNYRVLRMNEMPEIEVHLVKSGEAPGGIGEPGTAGTAAALANAVFAATGKRIRRLPIQKALATA